MGMKRGLQVFISLGTGLLFTAVAGAATIGLDPSSQAVGLGDMFTVDVVVADVVDLNTYQYSLAYDPAVLSVVMPVDVDGSFLTDVGPVLTSAPDLQEAGRIKNASAALLDSAAATGGGVLSTITFQAVGPGTSALAFLTEIQADTFLVDPAFSVIPATLVDGSVVVVPEPGSVLLVSTAGLFFLWRRQHK